jgi:hypothetical protein
MIFDFHDRWVVGLSAYRLDLLAKWNHGMKIVFKSLRLVILYEVAVQSLIAQMDQAASQRETDIL